MLDDDMHTVLSLLALSSSVLEERGDRTFFKGAKQEVYQIVRGLLLEEALC